MLVDESQFLTPAQVRELSRVVDELNVPVLCYGLRTDFRGALFPGSAQLLGWADNLVELKTICHCGRKATMVVRVRANGAVETEGAQVLLVGHGEAAVQAVQQILRDSSGGDILVFMPGERDIREAGDLLEGRCSGEAEVIPLYGRLSSGDQQRVFAPSQGRRVIIATNIAETSLTLPGILPWHTRGSAASSPAPCSGSFCWER